MNERSDSPSYVPAAKEGASGRLWYRRKRVLIPAGLFWAFIVAVVISAIAQAGSTTNSASVKTTTAVKATSTTAAPTTTTTAAPVTTTTTSAVVTTTDVPAATPTTPDACAAFWTFDKDITTYTPKDTARLIPDARAVQGAAQKTGRFVNDANALVAYVGSADFSENGNVLGDPIQSMLTDCTPGASP